MAPVLGHIREVRYQILRDAGKRWTQRRQQREAGLKEIERRGVGAADTVKRQVEYAQRMRNALRTSYGLNTREAIIDTNDLVAFAPSEQSRAAARPVARIVTLPGDGYKAQGIATGFLITSTGLLLTNHHVFPSRGDARGYGANFRHEEDEHGVKDGQYFELDPDRFFVSDADLDFAIVAVKPRGLAADDELSSLGFARLIEATGKVMTGEALNIIQHPNGGPRRYAVRNNQLVDILSDGYLHYEGDTLRGSSGSPVLSTRWELVALHHSAVPEMKDGVPQTTDSRPFDPAQDDLSAVKWIANEGTRASFVVESLRKMKPQDPGEQLLLDGLLASTADPLGGDTQQESVRRPPNGAASFGGGAMGHVFNISGPTTIHAYSPVAPAVAAVAVEVAPAARAAIAELGEEKTLVFDLDYPQRRGYNPKFLGSALPLPKVAPARAEEMYTVADYKAFYEANRDVPEIDVSGMADDEILDLKYHHYSLAFNKKFFMCAWTASNCDYREVMRQDTRKRSDLGGENWRVDPRVPTELQLRDIDIYKPGTRIDRGHIVRREDSCWGPAGLDTEYANSDTYHFTNCTPQHEAFNQANPKDNRKPTKEHDYAALGVRGIWGVFESDLESQIENSGGKAVIFAGPVLKNFLEVRDWGTGRVSTPRKFWKVVVVPESRRRGAPLLAYGYIFDQSDVARQFGLTFEEAIDLPQFDRKRKTLAEISTMADIEFPDELIAIEVPAP